MYSETKHEKEAEQNVMKINLHSKLWPKARYTFSLPGTKYAENNGNTENNETTGSITIINMSIFLNSRA